MFYGSSWNSAALSNVASWYWKKISKLSRKKSHPNFYLAVIVTINNIDQCIRTTQLEIIHDGYNKPTPPHVTSKAIEPKREGTIAILLL